ncbi:hypothetical protein EVAR_74420_1 [Eumeta japonica]|uniref:Uncharacterized protein n=1 Tax=Eumeta variegata TaxID=151549 RepID=A0A4C1SD95_EUMVA|nr:hypothetical protein EVAR_74420_1 [Eumeta japonica]
MAREYWRAETYWDNYEPYRVQNSATDCWLTIRQRDELAAVAALICLHIEDIITNQLDGVEEHRDEEAHVKLSASDFVDSSTFVNDPRPASDECERLKDQTPTWK